MKEIAPLDAQTASNEYTFSCIKNNESGYGSSDARKPRPNAHATARPTFERLRLSWFPAAAVYLELGNVTPVHAQGLQGGLAFGTRSVRPLTQTADRNCSSDFGVTIAMRLQLFHIADSQRTHS